MLYVYYTNTFARLIIIWTQCKRFLEQKNVRKNCIYIHIMKLFSHIFKFERIFWHLIALTFYLKHDKPKSNIFLYTLYVIIKRETNSNNKILNISLPYKFEFIWLASDIHPCFLHWLFVSNLLSKKLPHNHFSVE